MNKEEKSIMDKMQSAAEAYFSGPIPDGSAYSGENIRKNYHVIQRAAAEWGAKWIAQESGIKTYNPSASDKFLSYLEQQIDNSDRHMREQSYNLEVVEYCKGQKDAYLAMQEKYNAWINNRK